MSRRPHRTSHAAATVAAEPWLARLRQMLLIRGFELEIQRQFLRGEVHGTTHLYNGQEAISVGVCSVLRDGDYVAATYRGHGAALALGISAEALAAELMGRTTGIDGGRGGSMNVIDLERGLVGCFGIVGGSIGAAIGAAISAKRHGGVAVAFFGDGATNQAYFHECLNFAVVRCLPAIFVCENNLYGEFTPMERVTASDDIAARAAAYYMPSRKVDGNAIADVVDAAEEAVRHAREQGGPAFLECLTYRQLGHSKSDPATYRPTEERDAWLARDPIELEKARLRDVLGVDAVQIAGVEADVARELAEAIEAALAAPVATPENDCATEYAA
ncbi:MAG TPA: thiamine pyrophosphate-dependent dehydrogenase E1 component subunit alpha [Solirubrobacteraceae bacterium]|nr:thiamine pyrophosphate-dependent dehydrogenase E1 component subunit alpha [Solirubrobacteraceae bacterium]